MANLVGLPEVEGAWENGCFVLVDKATRVRMLTFPAAVSTLSHQELIRSFVGRPIEWASDEILWSGCNLDKTDDWTETAVSAGAGTSAFTLEGPGGRLLLTTAANEDDGAQLQQKHLKYLLAVGYPLWFEAIVRLSTVTQADFFIGLSITDATILASNPDDFIGWITHDGDANLDFTSDEDAGGPALNAAQTLAVAGAWVRLGFYWDGVHTVYPWYCHGSNSATLATAATPITTFINHDEAMGISIAYLNGAAGATNMWCNYLRVVQLKSYA